MKLTIELNEKQAKAVIDATDLQSRIMSGQLEDILLRAIPITKNIDRSAARQKIQELKEILFPELDSGELYGVFSDQLDMEAKILYDIHQAIRYKYSWHQKPEGGFQTWFDDPMRTSDFEIPKVTVKD